MNRTKYNPEEDRSMFDWWKIAMFDNYANFKGRARRKEYWYTQLMHFIVFFILYIPLLATSLEVQSGGRPNAISLIFIFLLVIYSFGTLIPSLALIVRRLHDVGKSGYFWFIGLIPLIGAIFLLIQYVTDSQNGENQWGPNPKGIGNKDKLNEIGVSEE